MLGDGGACLDTFGLGVALAVLICWIAMLVEIILRLNHFNFLSLSVSLLFSCLFTVKHFNPELSCLIYYLNFVDDFN